MGKGSGNCFGVCTDRGATLAEMQRQKREEVNGTRAVYLCRLALLVRARARARACVNACERVSAFMRARLYGPHRDALSLARVHTRLVRACI